MATAVEPSSPVDGPAGAMSPQTPRGNDLPLPPVPQFDSPNGHLDPASKERVQHVLSSDIGITTLLNRLKQSISSARDFASFLKERSTLEEKHAQGLKRLSRNTNDSIRRPENRQGSFAQSYEDIANAHDRMAEHGITFSNTLFAMSEELYEMATTSERGRKHWKQTGLNAEKRVQEAENAMEKAKGKYNSLAEHYDRARTGEKQPGKFVALKKSAAQLEEDLHRKLEAADGDYASKVQAAQSQQHELLTILRPQTVNALQELINETDAGVSVQVQKFAVQSEKLLLGYGLCITPLKGQSPGSGAPSKSLREIAASVNSERDFVEYVLGFTNKAGTRPTDIKYEKHPSLSPKQQQQSQPPPQSYNPPAPDPYGNYQPNHGRQVSGVTPYQGDGYQGQGPPSQSPPANPGQGPNSFQPRPQQAGQLTSYGAAAPQQQHARAPSGAPQLPQLDSLGGDRFDDQSSGFVPPVGPGGHIRGPSSQTSNAPGPSPAASMDYMRSPVAQNPPGGSGQQYGQTPPQVGVGPSDAAGMKSPNLNPTPPASSPPPNAHPALRPPRGASLPPQSGGIPSAGPPAPMGTQNAAPRPQMGPQNGPQNAGLRSPPNVGGQPSQMSPQNAGPRPPQMGRGQAPPGGLNAELRPAGTGPAGRGQGPGGQTGMPQQGPGPRGPGSGPAQGGPPTNGAPRAPPAPNGAPRPAHPGPGGSINSLPSRAQAVQRPPVRPVFGVSLDELFQRDGTAVPTIVSECVQAVELYGLDVEGIYRTSGSAHHIMELRQQFDHDSTSVDFRNPAAFHNDIAAVTTLLKHFLRDLPDPLLTAEQYQGFIQAAKLEDDTVRRDTVHALVNGLPDPNYATLRVITLHLHRVAQHSDRNKMTHSNLAIVFAPTLMGQQGGVNGHGPGSDIADAGWQAKVVETILDNTFQIFDDDE